MAALDFPHLGLSVGQTYPNPAVAGQPVYTWDGEKWTAGIGGGDIYISDIAPAAPVGSLWWESDTGILYVRYNDGTSTQWVAIAGGGTPSDAVLFTVQTLSDAQKVQARSNIYAAPFDALAYNGMQVNGSMEVNEENTSNLILSATAKYIVDGWLMQTVGSQVVNGQVFSVPNLPSGFKNGLQMWVSTANAAPGAADAVYFQHRIEGYRVARLDWGTANAQSITLAFWVYSSRTGAHSGSAMNGAFNRNYAFSLTINAASTWEYKTVTIPGDTSGAWVTDNTAGLAISIAAMSGSTSLTAAGVWAAGAKVGVTGTANVVASTADVFRITGVVILPGIEAPSAARSSLIMRPFDQELITCQRYWQKSYDYTTPVGNPSTSNPLITGRAQSTTEIYTSVFFTQQMRAQPTVQVYSYTGSAGFWSTATNVNTAAANAAFIGNRNFGLVQSSGLTAGNGYYGHYTADARL